MTRILLIVAVACFAIAALSAFSDDINVNELGFLALGLTAYAAVPLGGRPRGVRDQRVTAAPPAHRAVRTRARLPAGRRQAVTSAAVDDDTNRQVLQALYDALGAGDLGGVLGFLSDDIDRPRARPQPDRRRLRGQGGGGRLRGPAGRAVGRHHPVRAPHRAGLRRPGRGPGHGTSAERGDKTLAVDNVHVWRMGDGTLDEIWIYPGDQYAWDEFWS